MIISVNTFMYVRSDQYGFQACIYQLLLKESWFDFFFLFFFFLDIPTMTCIIHTLKEKEEVLLYMLLTC